MNALAKRFPALRSIPLGRVPLMLWQKVGPLAGLGEIDLVLWPLMVGLAFLLPREISLSCWVFWLVRLALTVVAISTGHTPQLPKEWWESSFPAPYHQAGGAIIALALLGIWTARSHLTRVARIAFSRESGRADAHEPLPYRWALIGLAVSCTWLGCFLCLAGCRRLFAAVVMAMILGFYLAWAKLRAETGLGFLNMPFELDWAIIIPFGNTVFRSPEIVALLATRWAYYPGEGASLGVCPAGALEAMKVADVARVNARRLAIALGLGFVFALGVGVFVTLTGIYHYGYYGLEFGRGYHWPPLQTRMDGERIVRHLTTPTPADIDGLIAVTVGAAVVVALSLLRLSVVWWPLHPVGYLAANCYGMQWFYMPFFVGWLGKSLVLRYGGLRLYRKVAPLATGVIAGDLLSRGLWATVALITQGQV